MLISKSPNLHGQVAVRRFLCRKKRVLHAPMSLGRSKKALLLVSTGALRFISVGRVNHCPPQGSRVWRIFSYSKSHSSTTLTYGTKSILLFIVSREFYGRTCGPKIMDVLNGCTETSGF
ncbi:hypothetical protein CDAR_201541 [Caerostris darwini]|uniref:Uncharacterized protein n=1 Tax=Caerostris darwini TaxID=1538125 RepID=A0AAV4TEP1_9ARAC|nr:hypothetical protein CDAR_201541 [Caerostris darwini]